jgi:hypothetical protein
VKRLSYKFGTQLVKKGFVPLLQRMWFAILKFQLPDSHCIAANQQKINAPIGNFFAK